LRLLLLCAASFVRCFFCALLLLCAASFVRRFFFAALVAFRQQTCGDLAAVEDLRAGNPCRAHVK
jgi:hypothetical protein